MRYSDAMLKKIMIATDGSDASKEAAAVGIDIAHRSNGSVTAIYVMDIFRLAHLPGYATLPGLKEKILDLMREEGKSALEYIESKAQDAHVPCHKILAQGNPSDEILKVSGQLHIDLLVMGRLGRSDLEKFLLGNVAERVVLQSAIPVLLIKGDRC